MISVFFQNALLIKIECSLFRASKTHFKVPPMGWISYICNPYHSYSKATCDFFRPCHWAKVGPKRSTGINIFSMERRHSWVFRKSKQSPWVTWHKSSASFVKHITSAKASKYFVVFPFCDVGLKLAQNPVMPFLLWKEDKFGFSWRVNDPHERLHMKTKHCLLCILQVLKSQNVSWPLQGSFRQWKRAEIGRKPSFAIFAMDRRQSWVLWKS